jgi:hypothetical protein
MRKITLLIHNSLCKTVTFEDCQTDSGHLVYYSFRSWHFVYNDLEALFLITLGRNFWKYAKSI